MPEPRAPSVAVILASAGRPALLADAVRDCAAQRDVEFVGVVSVPDEDSLPVDRSRLEGWEVVIGVRGLAAQRNAGLAALSPDIDIVVFFDDDAVVRHDYLSHAVSFFQSHPDVVGLTGHVLADGKITGEIAGEDAAMILVDSTVHAPTGRWSPTRELYGANFAYRRTVAPDLRFDDRLPLYSWLEDHDFARRLMPYGPLAHVEDCVIVHRAASSGGRTSHLRLGYSQVMNPVYLYRAGSFPLWLCAQQLGRPVAKNLALAVFGRADQWSWRRERLRGNVTAVADVLRGCITPERIADLQSRGSGPPGRRPHRRGSGPVESL